MRRITLLVLTIALVLVVGGVTAWAGDCIIASRSERGNAMAGTHSASWVVVSVSDFAHSSEFPPGVDPDCFLEHWLAGGGPATFTTRSNKIIGEGTSNPNLADGKGLDHIEEAYGPLFGASVAACTL